MNMWPWLHRCSSRRGCMVGSRPCVGENFRATSLLWSGAVTPPRCLGVFGNGPHHSMLLPHFVNVSCCRRTRATQSHATTKAYNSGAGTHVDRANTIPSCGVTTSPRRRSLEDNPLCRWSRNVRWPPADALPCRHVGVGLEGCGTALNATNAIRTALYFGTTAPTFLRVTGWQDIVKFESRDHHHGAGDADLAAPFPEEERSFTSDASRITRKGASTTVAHFGKTVVNSATIATSTPAATEPASAEPPIIEVSSSPHYGGSTKRPLQIAMEIYDPRATCLDEFTFPEVGEACNIIVGHENEGVTKETLAAADHVLFIRQYGTISSLNVVSALGIALAECHRQHQVLPVKAVGPAGDGSGARQEHRTTASTKIPELLDRPFHSALPSSELTEGGDGTTRRRVDPRPIHPAFYGLGKTGICQQQEALHQQMFSTVAANLPCEHQAIDQSVGCLSTTPEVTPPSAATTPIIRLGLLYDNDVDSRNLGGSIRNANAFACASVWYVGRRKWNRQGAVGSYHYVPVQHFPTIGGVTESADGTIEQGPPRGEQHDNDMCDRPAAASTPLVDAMREARAELWFLSCDQECLWEEGENGPGLSDALRNTMRELPVLYLDEPDSEITQAIADARCQQCHAHRIVLLVPQEGIPPREELMRLCRRVVCVSRSLSTWGSTSFSSKSPGHHKHRGLPSQIASAIALRRLTTVLLRRGVPSTAPDASLG